MRFARYRKPRLTAMAPVRCESGAPSADSLPRLQALCKHRASAAMSPYSA
jgi:hypothetical protein